MRASLKVSIAPVAGSASWCGSPRRAGPGAGTRCRATGPWGADVARGAVEARGFSCVGQRQGFDGAGELACQPPEWTDVVPGIRSLWCRRDGRRSARQIRWSCLALSRCPGTSCAYPAIACRRAYIPLFRGPSHSVHGPGAMIIATHRQELLTCSVFEPPIGIEPMTYALRGGLEPSTAVQAVASVLLVRLLIPLASRMVQGRC